MGRAQEWVNNGNFNKNIQSDEMVFTNSALLGQLYLLILDITRQHSLDVFDYKAIRTGMNTEEHELKHEGIANELDHVSDIIVKGEDTDEDLLKRIEALELGMKELQEQHRREIS